MSPDLNSLPPSQSRSPRSGSPLQSRLNSTVHPSSSSPPHPPSQLRRTPSPTLRSSSTNLAAAATMNALDLNRRSSITAGNGSNTPSNRSSPISSRRSERRRSAVAMNLNLNDPTIPGPGELSSSDHRSSISSIGHHYRTQSPGSIGGSPTIATGDPNHHQRTPSLGEIHQELEQEQEAQVNRLLQMIRTQQAQLQALQLATHQSPVNIQSQSQSSSAAIIDDSTPTSERSLTFHTPASASASRPNARRTPSRPSSRTSSPALRPLPHTSATHDTHSPHPVAPLGPSSSHSSSGEWPHIDLPIPTSGLGIPIRRGSRDESAYYQAETQNLTRENQMLRLRIRELERQLGDAMGAIPNTPPTPSQLAISPSVEMVDVEGRSQEPSGPGNTGRELSAGGEGTAGSSGPTSGDGEKL